MKKVRTHTMPVLEDYFKQNDTSQQESFQRMQNIFREMKGESPVIANVQHAKTGDFEIYEI